MKAMDQSGQSFFAPAPPFEALMTVLSLATTAIAKAQTLAATTPAHVRGPHCDGVTGPTSEAHRAVEFTGHRPDWDPKSPNRIQVSSRIL